jgi:hypothetical protein
LKQGISSCLAARVTKFSGRHRRRPGAISGHSRPCRPRRTRFRTAIGPSAPPSRAGQVGWGEVALVRRTRTATAAGDEQQDSKDCSKRHFHPPGSQTLNVKSSNTSDRRRHFQVISFAHSSDMTFAGSMHRRAGDLLVAKTCPSSQIAARTGIGPSVPRRNLARFGGVKSHLRFGSLPGSNQNQPVQTGCPNDTTIRPRHSDHGFPKFEGQSRRACARLLRNRIVAKHGSCLGFCAAAQRFSSTPRASFSHHSKLRPPVVRARPQACSRSAAHWCCWCWPPAAASCTSCRRPITAQDVELIYSASGTHYGHAVARLQHRALEDNRFEMLGPNGYETIDFSQSVFEGGVNPCTDKRGGSCAQYIVRGEYRVPDGARPVQAVHELYGVLPGLPPTYRQVSPTLTLESIFDTQERPAVLNIATGRARRGVRLPAQVRAGDVAGDRCLPVGEAQSRPRSCRW